MSIFHGFKAHIDPSSMLRFMTQSGERSQVSAVEADRTRIRSICFAASPRNICFDARGLPMVSRHSKQILSRLGLSTRKVGGLF